MVKSFIYCDLICRKLTDSSTNLLHMYPLCCIKNLMDICVSGQKMTKEQLACEKTVLQKNLLYYEGLHGRPVSLNSFTLLYSHLRLFLLQNTIMYR